MQQYKHLELLKNFQELYRKAVITSYSMSSEEVKVIEDFLKDICSVSDFCIRVPTSALPEILSTNRIKSGVELNEAENQISRRKTVVQTMFKVNLDELPESDYPKFGYLGSKDKIADHICNNGLYAQYGGAILTLNKKYLEGRVTMTVGDSVNFGDFFQKIPTFVEDPKLTCIRSNVHTVTPLSVKLCRDAPGAKYYHMFFEKVISGELTLKTPLNLEEVFNEGHGFELYELQIHGEIEFDKAIKQVDVGPLCDEEESKLEAMAPSFKQKNIPFEIFYGI